MNPATPATPPTDSDATPVTAATDDLASASVVDAVEPELVESVESLGEKETAGNEETAPVESELAESPVIEEPQPTPIENPALALKFSPEPGEPFQSSVAVDLVCAIPGARIFYAQDQGDVSDDGVLFDPGDKILLTQSTSIAARAFKDGESGPLLRGDFEVRKPLWQENEPADPTDGVPHKLSENLDLSDGWWCSAGSVRGKLHAHRALWREDSFAIGSIETGSGIWAVSIVSDGAGSAPLSRIGSKVACESALQSLRDGLGKIETLSGDESALTSTDLPLLRTALVEAGNAALQAVRQEAEMREQPLSAFAATLLILARREWNGAQLCGALQVGDGAIALDCESGLRLLGEADHGQHSSETRFLTTSGIEAEFAARIKFSIPTDLKATLVISDGVSDDYFPEDKRLGEVFDAVVPLVRDAPDAGEALLTWLGYEKKGSSDDRTLVLSWPGEQILEANDGS